MVKKTLGDRTPAIRNMKPTIKRVGLSLSKLGKKWNIKKG